MRGKEKGGGGERERYWLKESVRERMCACWREREREQSDVWIVIYNFETNYHEKGVFKLGELFFKRMCLLFIYSDFFLPLTVLKNRYSFNRRNIKTS